MPNSVSLVVKGLSNEGGVGTTLSLNSQRRKIALVVFNYTWALDVVYAFIKPSKLSVWRGSFSLLVTV